jgi:putative transcriptional regulator
VAFMEFVAAHGFEAPAKRLLREDDRRALKLLLLENPRRGQLMEGTERAQKARKGPGRRLAMKARKKATLGERLVESAREAVRIEGGEAKPARVTRYTAAGTIVEPPPWYVPDRIRGIRGHMALSQPVFAATLNVSPETVRAWEQGKRKPDGPTLRLLEVAEQHPEVLLEKVRPRLPAVRCRKPVRR